MKEQKNIISQLPNLTNNTKEYKIKYSNEDYNVKIGKTSATGFMIIIAKPINDNSNCYNIGEYSLNDLLDLSKVFWTFDSINEVIKEIQTICNNKVPILSTNKYGDLCLNLVFETYRSIDDISFKLTKKYVEQLVTAPEQKDSKENIKIANDTLLNDFNQLKKEVSNLRGEINLLKISLESKEEILIQKQKQFEEKIIRENMNKNTNNEKDEIIEKLIKRVEQLEQQNKKYEELLNKKKDEKNNSK